MRRRRRSSPRAQRPRPPHGSTSERAWAPPRCFLMRPPLSRRSACVQGHQASARGECGEPIVVGSPPKSSCSECTKSAGCRTAATSRGRHRAKGGREPGSLPVPAARGSGSCSRGRAVALERIGVLDLAGVAHDLETGQELDIARRAAGLGHADTLGLIVCRVFAQFCLSVSWAAVSSARQASLFRPRTTAPRPAASQLETTCSTGGPPPPPFPAPRVWADRPRAGALAVVAGSGGRDRLIGTSSRWTA